MNEAAGSREGGSGGTATLTFRGGGWLVVATLLVVLLVAGWGLAGVFFGRHPVGDGHTVESYGFQLQSLRVPAADLVASGKPRDFLPTLDHPTVVDGREISNINEARGRPVLVNTDRVLGVVVRGTARAYPLRILQAHEVANDEIAGVPVAVTYSPLCDCAMVFERVVAGRTLRFGISGLLLRSNLVMYDRDEAPAHVPSLWSQLGMGAISGPLAGTPLVPLPGVSLTTWAAWLGQHPDTEVILPDPDSARRYPAISYARYFLARSLDFPVTPLPPPALLQDAGLHLKSPVVAISAAGPQGPWGVVPLSRLLAAAPDGTCEWLAPDGRPLRGLVTRDPAGALLMRVGEEPLMVPCLWFAWFAFHPDAVPTDAPGAPPSQEPSQSTR